MAFIFLGLISLGFFRTTNNAFYNTNLMTVHSSVQKNSKVNDQFQSVRVDDEMLVVGKNEQSAPESRSSLNASSSEKSTVNDPNLVVVQQSSNDRVKPIYEKNNVDGKKEEYNSRKLTDESKGTELGNLGTVSLRSNIDKSLAPFAFYPSANKKVLVSPYLEVHAGLSQNLLTSSDLVSPYFGAGLGLQIDNPYWTLSVGLNGSIYSLSEVQLSHNSKTYSYGSRFTTHEMNYEKIYRLVGVVSVGRNFGKHQINLGIRPSFIASDQIRYIQTDQIADYRREEVVYGYTEGINRFGLKTTVGYAYSLANSWMIGANVGVQMRNTFENGYLNAQSRSLPIDGQVYIRKTFSFGK